MDDAAHSATETTSIFKLKEAIRSYCVARRITKRALALEMGLGEWSLLKMWDEDWDPKSSLLERVERHILANPVGRM